MWKNFEEKKSTNFCSHKPTNILEVNNLNNMKQKKQNKKRKKPRRLNLLNFY